MYVTIKLHKRNREVQIMNKPEVKLRPGVLEQLMTENDTNKTGLVAITGVSVQHIDRIAQGKSGVGSGFIAHMIKKTGKGFDDLFYVV
jgi:plasmid maintenance system antidote protein VapI